MTSSRISILSTILGASLSLSSIAMAQAHSPAPAESKPAQARTGAQLRFDSVASRIEQGSAPAQSSQGFVLTTARFGLSGDLNESIGYTLRLNLKSAANFTADRNTPDGGLTALDRAYIENRLSSNITLKIGRMPMISRSIENDYSSIDQYQYSYVNEVIERVSPITTGVDLTMTFGSHSISFDAFDGFYEGTVEKKGAQKGENMSYGVGYRSSLAGGVVKPIMTYDRFSRIRNGQGETRDEKATYTAYGIGTQISAFNTDVDIEYDAIAKPKFTSYNIDAATKSVVEASNLEQKVAGVIAQIAYTVPDLHLRAFAKISSDKETTDGKETFKAARDAFGVEFRPSAKGFRYHAVMTDAHDDATKVDGATATSKKVRTNGRQYIAGIAAKM